MDVTTEYRYYVVQFCYLPCVDTPQYVCVPDSWIQLREIADQVVIVKFPAENISITKRRVKNNEAFANDWSIYEAEVKYGTDSYEDAEKYIKQIEEKLVSEQSSSEPVNQGGASLKLTMNLRRSKRNQSKLRENKPQASEAPSNSNIESSSKQLAIDTKIATRKNLTKTTESVTQLDTSSRSLNGEQQTSNRENIVRREINSGKLNSVNSIKNSKSSENIIRNESRGNNGPRVPNELLAPTIISESILNTRHSDLVKKASELCLKETLSLLDDTSNKLLENCKTLEKIMDFINKNYLKVENLVPNYNPINATIEHTVASMVEEKQDEEREMGKRRQVKKRTQAEVGIIKRRETETNEQENDEVGDNDIDDVDKCNDDDSDDDDYVKRKRFRSRTLTLPPEYDKNDSKWTLRYREYAPGLVELIEHSGVYINASKLMNCKLAKNQKALARSLLVEIFTDSALRTCSLTGVRAIAFDADGTHVRPGLDENARTVLLTYIDQHAQANNWPRIANQSILHTIRNKMQEIRSKHNK